MRNRYKGVLSCDLAKRRCVCGKTARRGSAWRNVMAMLALAGLSLGVAASLAAAEKTRPPERTLFVPFEDLPIILGGENQRVFMDRAEYQRLKKLAEKRAPENAPVAAILTRAAYRVAIDEGLATVRGTLDIAVEQPGLHAVGLSMAGVRPLSATLDGKSAPLGRDAKGQPELFVQGVGNHQLELELQAVVAVAAAEQTLNIQVPWGTSSTLSLDVPGNVEVKSGASVIARRYDTAKNRTEFELLPQRGALAVAMSLNNRRLLRQQVIVARSVLVSELTTTYERLHASVSLDVLHGAVDRIEFGVPEGFQITSVESPLLAQWVVQLKDGKQLLAVTLRKPARDIVAINIAATRAPVTIGAWKMPQLVVRGVSGQVAVVGLLAESRLQPLRFETRDLIQIDTDVLRNALPSSVFAAEPSAPQIRPLAAYYAPAGTFALDATLQEPKDQLRVATHLMLMLEEDQQTLRGGFTLLPQGKRRRTFAFTVPGDWLLRGIHGEDNKPIPYERYGSAAAARYVVTLPVAIEPGTSLIVYFEATRRTAAWLGEWTTTDVDLPIVQVEQASFSDGAIAVQARGDLAVRPVTLQGLTPLDSSQRSRFGLDATGEDLAYQMRAESYQATFRVQRIKPRISSRNYAFFQVKNGVLIVHQELFFEITRARAKQLRVALPVVTPEAISIRGLDGTALKEFSATVDKDQRIWDVRLAKPQQGTVHLAIDFEQRVAERETQDLDLPLARALGVQYQTQMTAVEGDPALDIHVQTHMRPVDVGELAEAAYIPGRRLLGAYASTTEDDRLRVDVAQRDLRPLPAAIVQRAELVTLVSRQGLSQSVARYQLRTKVPLLAVRLPKNAELWSAVLDQKPLRPQRRGDQILLSLQTGGAGTIRDLQIIYQTPIDAIHWIGNLATDAPRLWLVESIEDEGTAVPQVDLVWRVHLPKGYRVSRADGTVFSSQVMRPKLPFAKMARTTVAFGGGAQSPFLLAASARARESARRTVASAQGAASSARRQRQEMYTESGAADMESALPVAPQSGPGRAAGEAADPFRMAGPATDEKLNRLRKEAKNIADQPASNAPAGNTQKPRAEAADMGGMMGMGGGMGGMGGGGYPGAEDTGMGGGMGSAGVYGSANYSMDGQPADHAALGVAGNYSGSGSKDGVPSLAFRPPAPAQPKANAKSVKYWALQGVRGLRIQIEDTSAGVTFQSLGETPRLQATVFDSRRMDWLAWAAALAVIAVGVGLSRTSVLKRIGWLAAIILPACLFSAIGGAFTEFLGVLEMIMIGAILLIPIWILIAFFSGLAQWLRWPSLRDRTVTSTVAILALAVTAIAGSRVQAQDMTAVIKALQADAAPVVIPDDAVVIPYDASDLASRNKAERVLVPYAQYTQLWKLVHPEEATGAQQNAQRFATAGASYKVTLADAAHLELSGTLDIVVFANEPVQVPLTLDNSVITTAALDGKPARLAAVAASPAGPNRAQQQQQQQQPQRATAAPAGLPMMTSVVVEGRGRHRLEVNLRVRVDRQGGWRRVAAAIPSAQATALTITVPNAGTQVGRELAGTTFTQVTDKPDQVIHAVLDSAGRFQVNWRPLVSAGDVDQALTADSQAVVDLGEDGVHVVWQIDFNFGQTQRSTFQLAVPAGYLVERVHGKNVRGWDLAKSTVSEDAASVLSVELLKAVKQTEQVTIQLARRMPLAVGEPVAMELPVVSVVDAALHRGSVLIRRSPILDVQTSSTTGVTRADNRALDKQMQSLIGRSPSPLGMQDYQTFRFNATPFRVAIAVTEVRPRVTAQLRTLLRIGETESALECQLRMQATNRAVYAVQVTVPRSLQLEDVTAPSISDWTVKEAGEQRVLTVFFAIGQTGAFNVELRGRLEDHKPRDTIELPILNLLDVDAQEGVIAIQADASLEVRAMNLAQCRSVLLDRVMAWLSRSQRIAARLAVEYKTVPYSGQIQLTPRVARITCDTISNVRLTFREIQETILLDFNIAQAGTRQVVFQLPDWMRDADVSAPMIRQQTVTQIEGERRVRVTLDLQDAVMGQYRVIVQNDRAITPGTQLAPLPIIESGTSNYRYVTLENAGRDEVVVEETKGLQPVQRQSRPWQYLAGRLQGADFTSAFVTTEGGAEVAFSYHTKRRATVRTAGANIGLALTKLVLDEGGAYRASTLLKVNNRTEPYLEIELPEGAALWTAHVANQPVKPARSVAAKNDRYLRIPLVKTATGDLDYPVVLKYGGKLERLSTLKMVGFPILRTTNVNTELSQVQLFLPKAFRWYQFDGTAEQVVGEGDFLAGYVAYRTRQVEGLTQVLRGKDFFSASRAYENVKSLEKEVQSIQRRSVRMSGNAQLRQNIDLNTQAFEMARQEMAELKKEAPKAVDNRRRLTELYDQQKAVLSRNEVLRLGENFLQANQQPQPQRSAQSGNQFDEAWFEKDKAAPVPPQSKSRSSITAGRKMPAAKPEQSSRLGASQQQLQSQQPAAQQAAQNVFQGKKAAAPNVDEELRNRGRGGGTSSVEGRLKRAYADRLQRESAGKGNVQGDSGAVAGGVVRRLQRADQSGPIAEPQAAGEPAPAREPLGAGLVSLDFTLPTRGSTFYFTAPRGDVVITARPVSVNNLDRMQSIACFFVFAILAWCAVSVVRRAPRSTRFLTAAALVLGSVGFLMVVTLILPVYGIALFAAAALLAAEAIRNRGRHATPEADPSTG